MRRPSSLALRRYSTEPRTREYVKEYGFLSFARKYEKQLLDTGADSLKTASKKVLHKTGEFLGKKTAEAVTKSNDNKIVKPEENPRNVKDESQMLKKKEVGENYDTESLFMEGYDYSVFSENEEESTDNEKWTNKEKYVNLSNTLPPLESDEEEIKGGKRLKFLTPNKLLFRLQIISINNSLKQFLQIAK